MPEIATFFPSLAFYLACCAVLLVAETVYVLFGFGAGMIAVGCLALFMPELRDVVVLILLVNLPAEVFVVARDRRQVQWRVLRRVLVQPERLRRQRKRGGRNPAPP